MSDHPHNTKFLSTLSLRRATQAQGLEIAPLCNFYPRSPCGERHFTQKKHPPHITHFYPRSPCGERLHYDNYNLHCVEISIHALLAESDERANRLAHTPPKISIHALLAESDAPPYILIIHHKNFYPRSPCGERPRGESDQRHSPDISIHALLAESDTDLEPSTTRRLTFLSTLSLRRATKPMQANILKLYISIHALLAESDNECTNLAPKPKTFLSTLSLRRATAKVHKTVGHFCAYETNFMGIASSC